MQPAFLKNQIVARMSRTNQLGKQDYFNNPRAAQDSLLRDPEQQDKAALVSRIMGTHNNQLEGGCPIVRIRMVSYPAAV